MLKFENDFNCECLDTESICTQSPYSFHEFLSTKGVNKEFK